MPAFVYRVSDAKGSASRGVVEASSASAARSILRERGHLVLELEEGTGKTGARARAGLPRRRLVLVTRQLATLIGSGMRIEEALSTIAATSPDKAAATLLNLRSALTEGRTLADAMADRPGDFPELYRATVQAGEQAGRLDHVLEHLANHLETQSGNRQTIVLALLYPALLTVVSLMIVSALMVFVVPDIIKVLSSRGAELPLLTRSLIAISGFVRGWGAIVALAIAAAFAAGLWVLRQSSNRQLLDRLLVEAVPTRNLVKQMNAGQFADTLAMLVQSGVPLVAALRASCDAISNREIRARVAEVARKVNTGATLLSAMQEATCFPPMMMALVASGEANARLVPALERAARDQRRELDAWVKAVVALIEPAILLMMGGFVMLIVLAILLPIVSMNSLVGL